MSHSNPNPFTPLDTSKATHSAADSSQNVTLPYIPELLNPDFLEKLLPSPSVPKQTVTAPTPAPTHPFADALKQEANQMRTDNNAPAFASTNSKTLDAFGTLDPNVEKSQVHSLLRDSWEEHPDLTLRIIWNLRSIHDGKATKIGFYRAFGWLYANHPKTAIANLSLLVDQVVEKKLKKKKENPDAPDAKDAPMKDIENEWTAVESAAPTDPTKEKEPVVPVGMSHGYYKDLLNILALAATDQLTHPHVSFDFLSSPRPDHSAQAGRKAARRRKAAQKVKATDREEIGKEKTAEKTAQRVAETQKVASEKAKQERADSTKAAHERLSARLKDDMRFRALFIAVARIFAKSLAADVKVLQKIADDSTPKEEKEELKWHVTLAGKWAPTLGASHDSLTNIATAISLVLYASGDMENLKLPNHQLDQALTAADADRLRSFYRRWIISPLRRQALIPEVSMSVNEWDKVNYSRVPSLSFARNKKQFFKHDEARLKSYLSDVAKGKKTISGATLGPHELIYEAIKLQTPSQDPLDAPIDETNMTIINGQWNTMVEHLREAGTLDNCLAVCDVSGSMGHLTASRSTKARAQAESIQPIFPAVALTLVLAQLAKPPFNNSFITFSHSPTIVTISSASQTNIVSAVNEIGRSKWSMTTDFDAVFMKLLLPMAVKNKLKRDEMVKRLFVFSDMQFDAARSSGSDWETNHQRIVKAFDEAGYDMPEIVYWNLAGRSAAKPITKDTPGVAMVSGFSGNLLKMFMEDSDDPEEEEEEWMETAEDGEVVKVKVAKAKMSPEDIMRKALGKKSFAGLKVVD